MEVEVVTAAEGAGPLGPGRVAAGVAIVDVARGLLAEALSLAQLAPSNSNIQPWRLFIVEGERMKRLREALRQEVHSNPRELAPLPASFRAHRRELGALVYGAMGVARDDEAGRARAAQRNYEFFGAPTAGILCMHRDLGLVDAVGVGMYLQTLILGLTARGIGTVEGNVSFFDTAVDPVSG
ncbi:hypothetical protein G4177_09290 [Corallococcus sp. ZKHCc1 1396]|uniref:Nitroreductase domain-containing protein n=2 Tax=Corallococcus soli TaxID=2710757 RepID=A0ABR9PKH7_9BACT|nr:nitroreductase family protein [Corallococcus soli]MBE4748360.1 hypothetical protein [Corallococcus soli]